MKLKPHMCDFMQTRILKKVILKSLFFEKWMMKRKYVSSIPPEKLASDWLTELVHQSEAYFLMGES